MPERTPAVSEAHPSTRPPIVPAVLTGVAAFAASVLWYSPLLFGDLLASLDPTPPPPPWAMLVAPLREIAAASVLSWLIVRLEIFEWRRALALGGGLWVAFHLVMMSGAVLFSGMAWRVAAIHAGDWLMKLLLISVLLSRWLGRRTASR